MAYRDGAMLPGHFLTSRLLKVGLNPISTTCSSYQAEHANACQLPMQLPSRHLVRCTASISWNCGKLYYWHHVAGVLGSIPLICRRSTRRRPRGCAKPLSATLGARCCLPCTPATLRSKGLPSRTPYQVSCLPQHLMQQLKSNRF